MKKVISLAIIAMMVLTMMGGAFAATLDGAKFTEPVKLTVEVFDRGLDGGKTAPEDNFYTNYIKEGLLRDHNIEVTFVPIPRWTEIEQMQNLLAAGDAPDLAVTYSFPMIQTYANMGAVTDLKDLVVDNQEILPNLWGWLEESNIMWDKDPVTGSLWGIEARLSHNARINTFIRKDWLDKLELPEPTNLEEFEAALYAFKQNAELLLGADADKLIPFSMSYDVAWRADHLIASYVPSSLTDREMFIYGWDDRHFLFPGFKEGIRKINEWYNAGLMWNDFALYGSGDKTEDNLIKQGFVGSFIHNWDYPFRDGENSIAASLHNLVGADAEYVTVNAFKDDAGTYKKFLTNPIDRKLFIPATCKEPVAALLYLDWISAVENRRFLQIGEEGVTHEVTDDGAIKTLATTTDKIMNSPQNIDYTLTINGLDLGDWDLTSRSIALNYPGIDPEITIKALNDSRLDGRVAKSFSVGQIVSEEGLATALAEKRDTLLALAIIAKPADFDKVYDQGLAEYMEMGGTASIEERTEKLNEFYPED